MCQANGNTNSISFPGRSSAVIYADSQYSVNYYQLGRELALAPTEIVSVCHITATFSFLLKKRSNYCRLLLLFHLLSFQSQSVYEKVHSKTVLLFACQDRLLSLLFSYCKLGQSDSSTTVRHQH